MSINEINHSEKKLPTLASQEQDEAFAELSGASIGSNNTNAQLVAKKDNAIFTEEDEKQKALIAELTSIHEDNKALYGRVYNGMLADIKAELITLGKAKTALSKEITDLEASIGVNKATAAGIKTNLLSDKDVEILKDQVEKNAEDQNELKVRSEEINLEITALETTQTTKTNTLKETKKNLDTAQDKVTELDDLIKVSENRSYIDQFTDAIYDLPGIIARKGTKETQLRKELKDTTEDATDLQAKCTSLKEALETVEKNLQTNHEQLDTYKTGIKTLKTEIKNAQADLENYAENSADYKELTQKIAAQELTLDGLNANMTNLNTKTILAEAARTHIQSGAFQAKLEKAMKSGTVSQDEFKDLTKDLPSELKSKIGESLKAQDGKGHGIAIMKFETPADISAEKKAEFTIAAAEMKNNEQASSPNVPATDPAPTALNMGGNS